MNGRVGLLVVIIAIIGLGAGAVAITWVRAPQGPDDTALVFDPEHEAPGGHDEDNHDGHEDAEGHGDHEGHDDHEEELLVQLSEQERKRFGVEVAVAESGILATRISLPGEIVLNADRVAHIVPRAPGIVCEVLKNVGDTVRAGETMAWLESAEMGEAKVNYLAKWAALSCCAVDRTRAQDVHDNTARFLEVLKSSPSLETLRDMDGRAMGDNRSILVSAYADLVFAKAAYLRERPLFEKKVASEREYQAAEAQYKKADALYTATRDNVDFKMRRKLLEAQRNQHLRKIELEGAKRRLYVLGLASEEITVLETLAQLQTSTSTPKTGCTDPNCTDCAECKQAAAGGGVKKGTGQDQTEERLAWYPLRAPFDGRVIDKHLTLGEKHSDDVSAFTVADLTSVWVNIAVYQKELPYVRKGMGVTISAGAGMPDAQGTIAYVAPIIDEKTRTALARAVLPNTDGRLRPGLFVTAEIAVGHENATVVIPKSAVQRLGKETVVFLDTSEGFKSQPVSLGRSAESRVEVVAGLAIGQRYVTQGAFELKAKIVTSGLDAHAGHGH